MAPRRRRPGRVASLRSRPQAQRRFSQAGGENARRVGQVYGSPRTPQQMAAAKAATIERLRMRYRHMRDRRWAGYRGYGAWFDQPINNAKLAATSVYGEQVPAFLRLFDLCSGDYPRFYASVRRIADKPSRGEALKAAESCD
ncbi:MULTISPECIES: aminopeptidase [unclassified Mesorhizobium]|uniref:aminopeptidase n=1 Tax=Mesorhizobium sp. M5C.F.Ca.IN.020.29.1.1 TaxID=2496770 RepID=UPI001FDF8448|nr:MULTISPECIES: aminopeptidase [unclassified Mesorhizobium]